MMVEEDVGDEVVDQLALLRAAVHHATEPLPAERTSSGQGLPSRQDSNWKWRLWAWRMKRAMSWTPLAGPARPPDPVASPTASPERRQSSPQSSTS